MKKILLSDIEKMILNNDKKIDKEAKKENKLKIIFLVCVISILFLLLGLIIGKNYNNLIIDNNVNEIITEYNYILNNFYGEIDKSKLTKGAINGMLSTLDSYSQFMGDDNNNLNILLKGEYYGFGFGFSKIGDDILVSNIYENSSAYENELKINDKIISINNKNIEEFKFENITNDLKNEKTIFLKIKRDGNEFEKKLNKGMIVIPSVSSQIIENNIGYLKINIFAENTDEQFIKKLNELEKKGITSLIIDVRDNSGGHLNSVENIINTFINRKQIAYQVQDKKGIDKVYGNKDNKKEYPIAILQNKISASASEMLISSLSDNLNSYKIGTKTFGKGTVQGVQSISGIGKYKMTIKKWLTPKGLCVDKIGIEPDMEVQQPIEFYSNPIFDNDLQLKKVIEFIEKRK